MSSLDLPLQPSADQIRRREFATIRRGYDPDQVREYLKAVGGQIERLEEQLRAARAEAASAAHELAAVSQGQTAARQDAYEELAGRMAEVLRTAERQAEDARRNAQEETGRMLAEARAEADRIRTDSQSRAEEVRQEADVATRRSGEEADRLLAQLASRRGALVAELEGMREQLLKMANGLESLGASSETPPRESAPTTDLFADPQFAELWAGPDPVNLELSDIPASLIGIEDPDPMPPPAEPSGETPPPPPPPQQQQP